MYDYCSTEMWKKENQNASWLMWPDSYVVALMNQIMLLSLYAGQCVFCDL